MTSATRSIAVFRRTGTGRPARLFLAVAIVLLSLLSLPHTTRAAERHAPEAGAILTGGAAQMAHPLVEDPLGTIGTKIENLAKSLTRFATPMAILAIVAALLMYLFAPFLPDLAQQNKGFIMRALVIIAIIGFVPELVKAFASLGASS